MTVQESANVDLDWWTPHVLIAIFCTLVAAILRAVPGWSAPLHAWIALAGFAIALLGVHAGARAGAFAVRRRGRDAALALLLAAGLGLAAATLMKYGRTHAITLQDSPLDEAPAATRR